MESVEIKENLFRIKENISEYAKKSGRSESSVKLCAVSKFHPLESVVSAISAGQFLFGENRVQEASSKFTSLEPELRKKSLLHIIGTLQTNKVKKAVQIADCIQSVDRLSLVSEIQKHCASFSKKIDVMLEIHTGEESKSGFTSLDDVYSLCEEFASGKYPLVNLNGLMTMAPFTQDEKLIHESFKKLRLLKEELKAKFPELPLAELSMGMSGDYRIAIEEGSTMVRIGTAIFGERNYNA